MNNKKALRDLDLILSVAELFLAMIVLGGLLSSEPVSPFNMFPLRVYSRGLFLLVAVSRIIHIFLFRDDGNEYINTYIVIFNIIIIFRILHLDFDSNLTQICNMNILFGTFQYLYHFSRMNLIKCLTLPTGLQLHISDGSLVVFYFVDICLISITSLYKLDSPVYMLSILHILELDYRIALMSLIGTFAYTILLKFPYYGMLYIILLHAILGIGRIVFAHIDVRLLLSVVKRTYAIELLLGLIVLIIVVSALLPALETQSNVDGKITTYFDALWYCFALVTTIGFGDYHAVSVFGRVISVVLGMYGIVIIAVITSVMTTFYHEMKEKDNMTRAKNTGS